MNLVRAGMVDDPAHYRWSSYRVNGLGQADALVTPHPIYGALGSDETSRRKHYRGLFRTHLDDDPNNDIRQALQQTQPLGNSGFADKIEQMTGQRREVKARGRPRKEEGVGNANLLEMGY